MLQSGRVFRWNCLQVAASVWRRQYIPRLVCLGMILAFALTTSALFAQSIISGDISGVVTDPSGAAVPNASVTLNSKVTGKIEQPPPAQPALTASPCCAPEITKSVLNRRALRQPLRTWSWPSGR